MWVALITNPPTDANTNVTINAINIYSTIEIRSIEAIVSLISILSPGCDMVDTAYPIIRLRLTMYIPIIIWKVYKGIAPPLRLNKLNANGTTDETLLLDDVLAALCIEFILPESEVSTVPINVVNPTLPAWIRL